MKQVWIPLALVCGCTHTAELSLLKIQAPESVAGTYESDQKHGRQYRICFDADHSGTIEKCLDGVTNHWHVTWLPESCGSGLEVYSQRRLDAFAGRIQEKPTDPVWYADFYRDRMGNISLDLTEWDPDVIDGNGFRVMCRRTDRQPTAGGYGLEDAAKPQR